MLERKIIEGEDVRTIEQKCDDEMQFRNKKLQELGFVVDNDQKCYRNGGYTVSFHNVENWSDVDFDKKLAKFEAQNKPTQDEKGDDVDKPKLTREERRASARALNKK